MTAFVHLLEENELIFRIVSDRVLQSLTHRRNPELTQVGNGVGVDVTRKRLLPLDVWVGNPPVLQSETLHLPRFTGQLPVHLHGRLVQDLSEETGRAWN